MMKTERDLKAITKLQVIALAVVAVVALIAGVVYYTTVTTPTPEEQVLVVGTTVPTEDLEPAGKGQWWAMMVGMLVGEDLFEFKSDTGELGPLLATSYALSSDAKTITIELREDVKFHDGTPFNASCVKYCWERCMELAPPVSWYLTKVDNIEVLDTYTVQVELIEPDVTWVKNLAIYYGTVIYSPSAVETAGDEWAKTVWVGSGPFKFVSFTKGEQLVLERNDAYWGEKPKLDKIIVIWYGTSASLRMALEQGDIDMAYRQLAPSDVQALEENPDVKVEKTTGLSYMTFLSFNMESEPLNNSLVRKAIAYAIDYDYLAEDVLMDTAKRAYNLMPSWITPYYEPIMEQVTRDIDKAKDFLAQAGYPEGFETTISYSPGYHGAEKTIVTAIQDMLKDIGITLHIEEVDVAYLHEVTMETGEYDMFFNSWAPDFPDPDNALFPIVASKDAGGLYATNYKNERLDELLIEGRATSDPEERQEIYSEVQQIIKDELPHVPLLAYYRIVAYRSYVKNWQLYPTACTEARSFANCYLEK